MQDVKEKENGESTEADSKAENKSVTDEKDDTATKQEGGSEDAEATKEEAMDEADETQEEYGETKTADETQEGNDEITNSKKEGQEDQMKKEESKNESADDKSKLDSKKPKQGEKRESDRKKRRRESEAPKHLMKTIYKFKAFRTELRNILFIKSDVPDPVIVAKEIMDLIIAEKPLRADAMNQLMPVQGVCDYHYFEVSWMFNLHSSCHSILVLKIFFIFGFPNSCFHF